MIKKRIVKLCLITVLCGIASACFALPPPRSQGEISEDSIKKYMQVLVSDSLQGRETGRAGQKKAALYIKDFFQHNGLLPAIHGDYIQHHPITTRANKGNNFLIRNKARLYLKDYFYPGGLVNKDSLIQIQEIYFAGSGTKTQRQNPYSGLKRNNGTVMLLASQPDAASVDESINSAISHGAGLVLVAVQNIDSLAGLYFYKKEMWNYAYRKPVVFITKESCYELLGKKNNAKIEKQKYYKSYKTDSTSIQLVSDASVLVGENVCGLIRGIPGNETVVVSAHYDHLGIKDTAIYYGADDNASGTAAIMEIARGFSQQTPPKRNILFVAFSGEEKGLLGSRYFVKHPPLELSSVCANVNVDMVGRIDNRYDSIGTGDYLYVIGSDRLSSALHSLSVQANQCSDSLLLDYTYNNTEDPNRYYFRSDHFNFVKQNIPAVFYFNGTHNDYHRPSDTIDKIDFPLLTKRARLISRTIANIANANEKIAIDKENEVLKLNRD